MELFEDDVWQMAWGERAAIEGLLSARRPALAIEVGTAEGASLRRIAAHSAEVHSFDVVLPQLEVPEHVTLHTGDSHVLLPEVLAGFAQEGRNVDFALVDGDHSAEGVRRDVEDLLASSAVRDTVIVTHDTGNELVRSGLDAVDYAAHDKVVHVDLDFVPGHLGRERFGGELWYGLGLIVVDADRPRAGDPVQRDRHHGGELLAVARDALAGAPARAGTSATALDARDERIAALEREVVHHRDLWQALMRSPSWRVTAPLRAAKRLAHRRG
ncbi:class I SAM-dependent methyltransferase [Patulibacter brassicae]|jgi:hypothetical protein|uniref:Class I SAM-dependent methyltransferase n=1 Tax=Patulibacter brassicae TaxID=1705717 RepID=A0ABU4VIJ9_9ACTN|nr:class I SAM-dependent methyltransferase [Patulibacter brassicae]MDX8151645.1 class I SAM-dependent methyltransferase [Patulibacter brassicae]